MCITLLFLLPSEQLDMDSKQSMPGVALPSYQEQNYKSVVDVMRNSLPQDGNDFAAEVDANNKNLLPNIDNRLKEVCCLICY